MGFEIRIIEFLQAGRNPFWDVFFQIVSLLGSWVGFVIFGLVLLIFRRKLFFWYLVSYGITYLTVGGLKLMGHRPRPFNASDTVQIIGTAETSYSFPSGHLACAALIAVFFVSFLFEYCDSCGGILLTILGVTLFVGLVCVSRMYLGMHYLTDVLAGASFGGFFGMLGLSMKDWVDKRRKIERRRRGLPDESDEDSE